MQTRLAAVAGALLATAGVAAAQTVTTTFSNGLEGWEAMQGPGGTSGILPTGGAGDNGHHLRTVFNNFWIDFRNNTNQAFLGDYTQAPAVTISADVQVDQIEFFFQPVSRPLTLELRNYDLAEGTPYPYVSVWYVFDQISSATHNDWTHFSVTIGDTSATDLPAGWGGYGDEDPDTYEPILPAGVTFTDVISNVQEIVWATIQPGMFSGFVDYNIGFDNPTVSFIPAPSAAMLLLGAGAFGAARRRR